MTRRGGITFPEWRRRHIRRERHRAQRHYKYLRQQLVHLYGCKCMACDETENLRIDHIVPVSRGGRTDLNNLQLLCRKHDLQKGTQIIDYRPKDKQD